MLTRDASYWVTTLGLSPHPEGGYYREVYRSSLSIPRADLPSGFSGDRSCCTSIFYLLQSGDFSAFHRIRSDEIWHFYAGGPLELHVLDQDGCRSVTIGQEIDKGHHLQYVVPARAWFAAAPAVNTPYALLGCTVSPGFDFSDFEMAERAKLIAEFPHAAEIVTLLTRQ